MVPHFFIREYLEGTHSFNLKYVLFIRTGKIGKFQKPLPPPVWMAVITKKSDFGDFIFVFFFPTHLDVLFFNRIVGSSPIHTFSEEKNSVFTHTHSNFPSRGRSRIIKCIFRWFQTPSSAPLFFNKGFPFIATIRQRLPDPPPLPKRTLGGNLKFLTFSRKKYGAFVYPTVF